MPMVIFYAILQQFSKAEILNSSRNSKKPPMYFTAIYMGTLLFCNSLLTKFTAQAPAVPVPELKLELISVQMLQGQAVLTEGQDCLPPQVPSLPLCRKPSLRVCSLHHHCCFCYCCHHCHWPNVSPLGCVVPQTALDMLVHARQPDQLLSTQPTRPMCCAHCHPLYLYCSCV